MMRVFAVLVLASTLLAASNAGAVLAYLGFKNSLIEFLLDEISVEGELEIDAIKVEEIQPGVTSITGLTVSDREGIWLTIATLDFEWNDTRLLLGEIEVASMEATGVNVRRAPVGADPDEDEAPEIDLSGEMIPKIAWPRSPLTLRVDEMILRRVALLDDVFGHAIAFDAVGSMRDEGEIQALALDISRTDDIEGSISFNYERNFTTKTFDIRLDAEESAGGLLTDLGGLPDDAPSRFLLEGDGPPEDWNLSFNLDLAQILTATGVANIDYVGRVAFDADFTASPGPRMAPEFQTVIGSEARLRAKASEQENGVLTVEEGSLTSAHANLGVSGTIVRPTRYLEMQVDLEVDEKIAAPFETVDLEGIDFRGRLTGSPGAFIADGDLEVLGLRTPKVDAAVAKLETVYRQSLNDTGTRTIHAIEVSGITESLRIDEISSELIGVADTEIIAAINGDRLELETLWLDSGILTITASGDADLQTLEADIGLGISTPDLAPVAEAYGVEASGALQVLGQIQQIIDATVTDVELTVLDLQHTLVDARQLNLSGVVRSDDGIFDFDLDGIGEALRIDLIGPEILTVANVGLAGRLFGGVLRLDAMRLDSPLLKSTAFGSIGLDDGDGKIDYVIDTPDLAPVAGLYGIDAGGRLFADGDMAFSLIDAETLPHLAGYMKISDLRWQTIQLGDADIVHDVRVGDPIRGLADITVTAGPYAPARLRADSVIGSAGLSLKEMTGSAFGVNFSGQADVDAETETVVGNVTINADEIKTALDRFGVSGIRGAVRGDLSLSAVQGRQDAALNVAVRNMTVPDARIGEASVTGSVRDVLGKPVVDLSARAKGVRSGTLALDTLRAKVKGPQSAFSFSAVGQGRNDGARFRLDTAGQGAAMGDDVLVSLRRLAASYDGLDVSLRQPARVRVGGGGFSADNLDVVLPAGASLRGDVAQINGAIVGNVSIGIPDVSAFGALAGLPFDSGSMSVSAKLDGRPGRARGTAVIRGQDISINAVDFDQVFTLDSRVDWDGRTAAVAGTLSGGFGRPVEFAANVPVVPGRPLPVVRRNAPMTGRIDWTGDVGDLWALLPLPGQIMTGPAKIDLTLGGTPARPRLGGGATIEGGTYQYLEAGTILTDVRLDARPDGDGRLVMSLTATDGADGRVVADGLLDLFRPDLRLVVRVDDAVVVRRVDVGARASGTITLNGPPAALAIGGDITINEAEVRLVSDAAGQIVTLEEVIYLGQAEPEPPAPSTTELDIVVRAPGRIFVRGRGLDSEWGMDLRISGDAGEPVMQGGLERVRGTLSLLGKTFDLERGRIVFDGSEDLDPLLDLELERRTQSITGRVLISGYASEPEINFRSTPALPEEEVLPRVIFGKARGEVRASQALQLAVGVATLLDGTGGITDQVRSTLGLDTLRIDENDEGEAAVAVGRQLNDRVWVGAKQDIADGGTSVVVEVEVMEDVLLDAELDRDGEASIGLEWKKDF